MPTWPEWGGSVNHFIIETKRRLAALESKEIITMSDIAALQASLAALSPEIDAVVAAVAALEAKATAAGVDVSAEIATINAFHDKLAAAVATTVPPVTPPAPPA